MVSKKKIYDSVFYNPNYRKLSYYEIEKVYKNALLGIDNNSVIEEEKTRNKYAYSPKLAVEYALKYVLRYNPSYPDYGKAGGDCANFISQALHAGGKPMIGSNATSMKDWFCRSKNKWDTHLISSTWRGASSFSQYWMANANSFKKFDSSYFKSLEAFKPVYDYGARGDALSFLDGNGRAYHTLIIVDYDKGSPICASHSDDSNNRSLFLDKPPGGVRIYRMS